MKNKAAGEAYRGKRSSEKIRAMVRMRTDALSKRHVFADGPARYQKNGAAHRPAHSEVRQQKEHALPVRAQEQATGFSPIGFALPCPRSDEHGQGFRKRTRRQLRDRGYQSGVDIGRPGAAARRDGGSFSAHRLRA